MTTPGEAPTVDQELVDFAVRTTRRAGKLIVEHFFAAAQPRMVKPDGTEVTPADLLVEEWYRDELARRFPDDGFYGEETGHSPGTSGRRWVVDPIQGTFWFVRGVPSFGTSLAFEDEHGPAVGVGHSPLMMETVLAGRGLGCWIERGPDSDPIRQVACVSQRRDLTGAMVQVANLHCWTEEFVMALHAEVQLLGEGALSTFVGGDLDLLVATHQDYEDLAIYPVIVTEAGGTVTAINGQPLLEGDGSILAANPRLHAQLMELVAGLPITRNPPTDHGQQNSDAERRG